MSFERPAIIRPPSEWASYFLPVTSGCSNNTCAFCNYYGCKLQIREVEDVLKEIDALALYMRDGFYLPDTPDIVYAIAQRWDGKKIFLQDGDALVYPFTNLTRILEHLNEAFPNLERIAAYATAQDIQRRSHEELKALSKLKLDILYLGVESGDDEVLRRIGKGVNHDQMAAAGRKAKAAGIALSVSVILGLGGVEGSERHALETARILNDIDPEYAGALTLTLVPGTPLYEEAQQDIFHPISPYQSLEELKIMIANSSFTDCFFSSMHASNYFSVRGRLPQEKERMLGELEYILDKKDPSMLRPEFLRGL
ncbi:radical SAM protein [Chloroflexota bacterium]